jgi:hypothetical protein
MKCFLGHIDRQCEACGLCSGCSVEAHNDRAELRRRIAELEKERDALLELFETPGVEFCSDLLGKDGYVCLWCAAPARPHESDCEAAKACGWERSES